MNKNQRKRSTTVECPVISSDVIPGPNDYVVRHREALWSKEDLRTTQVCLPSVEGLALTLGEDRL